MSDSSSKREIPTGLKKLLEVDVKFSKEFVEVVNRKYPIDTIRTHLKSLEVKIIFFCLVLFLNSSFLRSPVMVFPGSCSPLQASISPATPSLLSYCWG